MGISEIARYTVIMLNRIRALIEDKMGIVVRRKRTPYNLQLYEATYSKERLAEKPFYNIGAGNFWHPYWTNLDYISDWYAPHQKDILHYDLMALEPLPIASGSAEIIYTSHTIEHVKEDAVQNLFADSYRALRPGGILRVTTGPDAATDYRAMTCGDASWFYWDEWYTDPKDYQALWKRPPASMPIEERWLNHVASALAPNSTAPSPVKYNAEQIRQIIAERGLEGSLDYFTAQTPFDSANPGNHVSWWTHEKVMAFIRGAGFTNVYRSGLGQSVCPLMRHSSQFDSTHPQMSIYVEAIKE